MTIDRLITAIVQEQDADAAMQALVKAGFVVTEIGSSG